MYILDCKGLDGSDYCFKAHKIPTKEEFDEFIESRYPEAITKEVEYIDDSEHLYSINDIEIEAVYEYDDIEEIN